MGPLIEHSWQSYVYFLDFLFIFSVIIKAADFPDSLFYYGGWTFLALLIPKRVDFPFSVNFP